jgi:hypothetical protein
VSFTRGVWAAITVGGLLLIALLGTQVALIEDQRSTTDRQLAATAKQADAAVPLIRKAEPLVDQTIRGLPRTQELTRRAITLTRQATPLVRALDDARAPEQLQAAGALARRLMRADLPRAATALVDADLPRLSSDLARVADELLRQQRLRRLLVRSNSVLGEVAARDLVRRSARAAEIVPDIDATLKASLAVQRETLDINRELLLIAREMRHITADGRDAAERAAAAAQSIDRKTGPSLQPTAGG